MDPEGPWRPRETRRHASADSSWLLMGPIRSRSWCPTAVPLMGRTIECAGQHIPPLKLPTTSAILPGFRELVKVLRTPPWPTYTGQHNPIRAATDRAPGSMCLPDCGRCRTRVSGHGAEQLAGTVLEIMLASSSGAPIGSRGPSYPQAATSSTRSVSPVPPRIKRHRRAGTVGNSLNEASPAGVAICGRASHFRP